MYITLGELILSNAILESMINKQTFHSSDIVNVMKGNYPNASNHLRREAVGFQVEMLDNRRYRVVVDTPNQLTIEHDFTNLDDNANYAEGWSEWTS